MENYYKPCTLVYENDSILLPQAICCLASYSIKSWASVLASRADLSGRLVIIISP